MRLPQSLALVLLAAAGSVPAQVVWERVQPFPATPGLGFGDHEMVWDDAHQRVMLVNGYGDVWEWNGTWARAHVAALPPSPISLAYDTNRQRAVLYSEGLTWEWDGSRWTQRFPAISPPFRRFERMVYDAARARVVLFGGEDALGRALRDTWEWDGANWMQRFPASAPVARAWHALAYDAARRRVVLFGGAYSASYGDTWEWDGSNWTFRPTTIGPSARHSHAMAYDAGRGRVVLFGGAASRETWEWDGSQWTPRVSSTRPPTSLSHSMAYHQGRRRVVLWSGTGDTWEWDGNDWARFTIPVPPARMHAALAYDAARQTTLLFGGAATSSAPWLAAADTWEWDGARWIERRPATIPSARFEHAMVHDSSRGKVVMFGGNPVLGDAWEWDGTNWSQQLQGTPPPLERHAMTFDAARQRVVLFGGFIGTTPSNETWELSSFWQLRTPSASPGARGDTAIAYDVARQRSVLFGGAATSSGSALGLGDTWEWDGTRWTLRLPPVSPPPRSAHTMVYDSARQRVVLFGGQHLGIPRSDTWEWDGTHWYPRYPATGWFALRANRRHAMAYDAARRRVVMLDDVGDLWEYHPLSPASYAPFGTGCSGPAGVPILGAAPGSLPWAEGSFTARLAPLPIGQPAVLFFGVSRTSWSGAPLPLSLAVLGRADCSLRVSPDVAIPLASAGVSAALTIPLDPAWVGGVFYNQGASLALGAGTAGLAFSNGARAEIGAK